MDVLDGFMAREIKLGHSHYSLTESSRTSSFYGGPIHFCQGPKREGQKYARQSEKGLNAFTHGQSTTLPASQVAKGLQVEEMT